MELFSYSVSDIVTQYSDGTIPGKVFQAVMTAIDEDTNGKIDFIDASWSFTNQPEHQQMLGSMGVESILTLNPTERYYGVCPDSTDPTNDDETIVLNECPQEELTPEELQIANNLFVSLCYFLQADPGINPEGIPFQVCTESDVLTESTIVSKYIVKYVRASQPEQPTEQMTHHDEDPLNTNTSPTIVATNAVAYDDDPYSFHLELDGKYDQVLNDPELTEEDRSQFLDALEEIMAYPEGNFVAMPGTEL